jgi:hypothetical protein
VSFSCDEGGQGQSSQQKQIRFSKQSQSQNGFERCDEPDFEYKGAQVVNLDMNLDCDNQQVVVKNKGFDGKQKQIPIQNDGSVDGSLEFQQQLHDDGKGNKSCWIEYVAAIKGKAQCGTPQSVAQKSLQVQAQVKFNPSNQQKLSEAGVINTASSAPNPDPSQSPNLPPGTSGSVVYVPVKYCEIENPCPIEGKSDYSCPAAGSGEDRPHPPHANPWDN